MVLAALGVFMVPMHEVPGLARGERHAHGLGVAQLADHDDVGVLAQRALERRCERSRVRADLALAHHRLLARVHVLDRVFDRDHVVGGLAVDDVDDRRERAGLAVAGGPGDHDEALVVVRGVARWPRASPSAASVGNVARDEAERGLEPGALARDVDAEAARRRIAVEAEVARALLLERGAEARRNLGRSNASTRRGARGSPAGRASPATRKRGGRAGDEMQIAAPPRAPAASRASSDSMVRLGRGASSKTGGASLEPEERAWLGSIFGASTEAASNSSVGGVKRRDGEGGAAFGDVASRGGGGGGGTLSGGGATTPGGRFKTTRACTTPSRRAARTPIEPRPSCTRVQLDG